jgi:hypothetical protein
MELGNAHILKLHFEGSGKEFDIVQHSYIHTYIHTYIPLQFMAVTPLRRLSTMAICNYVRYKRSGLRAAENCNLNTSLLASRPHANHAWTPARASVPKAGDSAVQFTVPHIFGLVGIRGSH